MGVNEKIIFLGILGLGAIVGVLTYTVFMPLVPTPGDTRSIYRQDLPPETAQASAGAEKSQINPASIKADAILTILEGASTQGNPAYDPKEMSVNKGDVIKVDNKDTVPHTVTNGEGPSDPNSGKIFDTGITNAGEASIIDTKNIDPGDYLYYCTVHPYMTGNLKIQ
jgi:plastocyanin